MLPTHNPVTHFIIKSDVTESLIRNRTKHNHQFTNSFFILKDKRQSNKNIQKSIFYTYLN